MSSFERKGTTEQEEDLGEIIAKVQDDLQCLRAAANRGGSGADLQALEMVLTRTEQGMQAVAERVMQSTHNKVTTLPAIARRTTHSHMKLNSQPAKSARHSIPQNTMSPGQLCLVKHMSHLIAQPTHPLAHKMLASYYHLPFEGPLVNRAVVRKGTEGQVMVGSTVNHLTTLPKSNRRDPLLTPPAISQKDAKKGLLSLLERGLIPPAAEIVLSPPPVHPCQVRLHAPHNKHHIQQKIADGASSHVIRLDSIIQEISVPTIQGSIEIPKPTTVCTSQEPSVTDLTVNTDEPDLLNSEPHYESERTFNIEIKNGCLIDGVDDFICFKKVQSRCWNQILKALNLLVNFCKDYAIPLFIIDNNRLVSLSLDYELGLVPSKMKILTIAFNKTQLQELLQSPGQRYRGQNGRDAAASKIRATYLMYRARRKYLEYRRKKWAAGVVTMAWVTYLKLHGIKLTLKQRLSTQLKAHRQRATDLCRKWTKIMSTKRTIVHLPSQGYPQSVRAGIPNMQMAQSLQLGRLCDIGDPNVEVIYVSPVPLGEEMTTYWHDLLTMGGPPRHNPEERIHIVNPENYNSFKCHNMSLSSILLYSPHCMARIKRLTAGKEAYIVSGTISTADVSVASALELPVLGSEPSISQLYSTKAGARRLFQDAGVSLPPHEADIFSQEQFITCLSLQVANNLLIRRWLFKLPEQIQGRGFAFCDISQHLTCYDWVVKEAKRYGPKWKKRWAQEHALKKIASELPSLLAEHAHTTDTTLYPLWGDFLKDFLEMGGLIEGTPPSDSITPITVELLLEPSGEVRVLATLDQICHNYKPWGGSVPQTSVPHAHLMNIVNKVATACKARGILGYLSIDLLTFIHPNTMAQEVWCVDLDLCHSNALALYKLMSYVTSLQFNLSSGALVNPKDGTQCYAILAPQLYHTNLSLVYHSIFFQMCKAHFIGYDPNEKLGTLFNLVDNQQRQFLGMICLQKTLLEAVEKCSSNLSIIHQEISTPTMQGISNFKEAVKELDKIAELINSNIR